MSNGKLSCWIYVNAHLQEEIAHRILKMWLLPCLSKFGIILYKSVN